LRLCASRDRVLSPSRRRAIGARTELVADRNGRSRIRSCATRTPREHAHAIDAGVLALDPRGVPSVMKGRIVQPPPEPRDWRLRVVVRELANLAERGDRIMPLSRRWRTLRRGDPAALGVYRRGARAAPEWPPLVPLWQRLAASA